ncbi:hypothetical protein ACQPYE_17500 [Actinosynnema sp. CA-299493]
MLSVAPAAHAGATSPVVRTAGPTGTTPADGAGSVALTPPRPGRRPGPVGAGGERHCPVGRPPSSSAFDGEV